MSNPLKPLYVIIPMVGKGSRFKKAGYETYKPFISIEGQSMLAHALSAFPSDVQPIIITNQALITPQQQQYMEQTLGARVLFVPQHADGPAASILAAREQLPLDASFFIAYCDIMWRWDFETVRPLLDHDGVVFTHKGFHPHLVQDNFSAFCRPQKDQPNQLAQIREKSSFTEAWMEEPLSIGSFYVKHGHRMIAALEQMVAEEQRVAGEFFPSLMFNHLVADGASVALSQVSFFIHFGVPDQLNDYLRWHHVLGVQAAPEAPQLSSLPHNAVTMAGLGERMSAISQLPKALIPIDGQPMYAHVAERFPSRGGSVITTEPLKPHLSVRPDGFELLVLPKPTRSQFETLQALAQRLPETDNLYITSCDAYGVFDVEDLLKQVEQTEADAVIFCFAPSLMQKKLKGHHTHVSVDDGRVTKVHIKSFDQPDDPGLAGFFWLRDSRLLSQLSEVPHDATNEMCADHFFKYLVDKGYRVLGYDLQQYVHLGTVEELLEYHWWSAHADVLFSEEGPS
ncbi:NTP transferase domain-containing protein [Magnetococcus sp. PR-3]|uniref:NTP transferase domain-containing protein n=1 Tax=Magnetococcus sp. PR-3 TaxID=3120355 RepID=UPI002FCDE679